MRIVLTFCLLALLTASAAASQLNFTNESGTVRLQSVLDDGSTLQKSVTFDAPALGLAVDTIAGVQYFSTESRVFSANLDGSNVKQLFQDVGAPIRDVAVDHAAGKIYFNIGNQTGILLRANTDGSGLEQVLNHNVPTPGFSGSDRIDSFTLDAANHAIYFVDQGDNDRVRKLDLNTGTTTTLISYGQNVDLIGIGVDAAGGKVYWSTRVLGVDTYQIERANVDGSSQQVISTEAALGVTVDAANSKLYVAEHDGIKRMNLDGSSVELVKSLPNQDPTRVALSGPVAVARTSVVLQFAGGITSSALLADPGGVGADFGNNLDAPGSLVGESIKSLSGLDPDVANSIDFALGSNTPQFWTLAFSGTFNGQAAVTFVYDDSDLNVPEDQLQIFHQPAPGIWEQLAVADRDTNANTITVLTSSFSPFGLGSGPDIFVEGVPEPATWGLLAMGMLGLLVWRPARRRG